jgi:hypothetical protein
MNARPHIEIPPSFFEDLGDVAPVRNTFGSEGKNWTPAGAMKWYDSIIDDILTNPGTDLTQCAQRLGRAPNTVQTIVRSDMFKARFAQRRQQFEAALDMRLIDKLTKTAELSLDATIEQLKKKRDAIPLPVLTEITKSTLDRLGYSPSRSDSPLVNVQVNSNVVSPEALEKAREKLKLLEGKPIHPTELVAGPPGGVEREED